uniref:Uncharacterized protein n=1 Tax=Fagus sylvatica TaxID=28930 RepID=A0A2N9EJ77_FAGSY
MIDVAHDMTIAYLQDKKGKGQALGLPGSSPEVIGTWVFARNLRDHGSSPEVPGNMGRDPRSKGSWVVTQDSQFMGSGSRDFLGTWLWRQMG